MKSRPRPSPPAKPDPPRIVDEGLLEGDFEGFEDIGTVFVFTRSRRQWRQAEHKYSPYYAYMPAAKVIQHAGLFHLEVRGMRDRVRVVEVNGS